jgi:hypothetical protein
VLRHFTPAPTPTPTRQTQEAIDELNTSIPVLRQQNRRDTHNMTGFGALSMADEAASEGSAQWAGVAKVLGPRWARLPALTVGLVGAQVLWSIEMAYGELIAAKMTPDSYVV